jgi:hypothetical protein
MLSEVDTEPKFLLAGKEVSPSTVGVMNQQTQ